MEGDPRPVGRRASLRGRGREILLGQRVGRPEEPAVEPLSPALPEPAEPEIGPLDATALKLSAQETRALLDFSADAPLFQADFSFPEEPRLVLAAPASRAQAVDPAAAETDAMFLAWAEELAAAAQAEESGVNDAAEEVVGRETPLDVVSLLEPASVPAVSPPSEVVAADIQPPKVVRAVLGGDAAPLAERDATIVSLDEPPYHADPVIEALTPTDPEVWPELAEEEIAPPPTEPIPTPAVARVAVAAPALRAEEGDHEGGQGAQTVASEEAAFTAVPDPFAPTSERLPAEELFPQTDRPNRKLLELLVDDERIRRLADQIEALQEELATRFHADWAVIDAYQRELLEASGKLLASRSNYDDARAIVYRVRTDMNRLRKINADIMRYRPLLLNYYIGWGIALGVLFLLKALFVGVTDAVGIQTAAAMYYPLLLGIAGALLSGLLTLERHTTRLRDFDPIHISWYLSNPLLGGAMGLLMFVLASIANEDLLRETASDAEHAITYLLCVVAGMNQNQVLRQLNELLRRFGRGGDKPSGG